MIYLSKTCVFRRFTHPGIVYSHLKGVAVQANAHDTLTRNQRQRVCVMGITYESWCQKLESLGYPVVKTA